MDPLRGIVYRARDGTLVHLRLNEVRIHVSIIDVSAKVTIRQAFENTSDSATNRAKYVLPIPSRAAVCGFSMHFSDRTLIEGIVMEKEEAAREHESALREGRATGLVTWATDDVFTLSVGSIAPREVVTSKITLVMDLLDDGLRDSVRLHLPMYLGDRYGVAPQSVLSSASPGTHTRLKIDVDIQCSDTIRSITSSSHSIALKPYLKSNGTPSRRRHSVKLRSSVFLRQDFVLQYEADGLGEPRCFVERDAAGNGTLALQLTLIPRFSLPPTTAQEYLFLVDRSGSMEGSRIETARDTLISMLRMIPVGSTFNIFSFGNNADSLWPQSLPYSAETLASASDHAQVMEATYGGTEISKAVQAVFLSRNSFLPSVVFVLTDGQSYDVDAVFLSVRSAVDSAPTNAQLRVYSLGIGEEVSTAMVEGIARFGGGECLYATDARRIMPQCIKLFQTGRSSYIEDVDIDWGVQKPDQRARATVTFLDDGTTALQSAPAAVPQYVRQSPVAIRKLTSGTRLTVFSIIEGTTIPKEVIIRGKFNGGDDRFQMAVRVHSVAYFDASNASGNFIHPLAARRLMRDILDGLGSSLDSAAVQPAVVQLSKTYQVPTRYTSFVAVDRGRVAVASNPRARNVRHDVETSGPPSMLSNTLSAMTSALRSLFGLGTTAVGSTEPTPVTPRVTRLPGHFSPSVSESSDIDPDASVDDDTSSLETFSTLSSFFGSDTGHNEPSRSRSRSPGPLSSRRSSSPQITPRRASDPVAQTQDVASPAPAVPNETYDLLRLQSFDGSFDPSPTLAGIVGALVLQQPQNLNVTSKQWATAVVAAYFRKELSASRQYELLDGLLLKMSEFFADPYAFESVVRAASQAMI